jgi:hypothetical protein
LDKSKRGCNNSFWGCCKSKYGCYKSKWGRYNFFRGDWISTYDLKSRARRTHEQGIGIGLYFSFHSSTQRS